MPGYRQQPSRRDGAAAASYMHFRARMDRRGRHEGGYHIDRSKHDLDILEHVMGGVHTWPDVGDHVVDVSVNRGFWVGGRFVSAVEVQVLGPSRED